MLEKVCLGTVVIALCLVEIYPKRNSIPKSNVSDEDISIAILDYDLEDAIKRLSGAITFETVSRAPGGINATEILKFHDYLEKSFPKVHSTSWVEKQVINLSLVYIVKPHGTINDKPWILQGHQDVVPITDRDQWTAPPFGGKIIYRPDDEQPSSENSTKFLPGQSQNSDWFVYGRGTMDCKHIIMASLEALEHMIGIGLRPRSNTLVLSYPHDEETGGIFGAKAVAQYLKERFQNGSANLKPFQFLLDEGFNIIEDVLPQNAKLAPIGVSEKTTADITMTVKTSPGHSSVPPKENAISILAEAVLRLQAYDFPPFLGAPGTPDIEFCRRIAPLFPENRRILLLNADLFTNEIPLLLAKSDLARAMITTTKTVTLINGGVKTNIVPSWAQANINHRIHPLQTPKQILYIDIAVVNDSRVHFELNTESDPQPISDFNSTAFANLEILIHQLFGEGGVMSSKNQTTIVVPAIFPAGTDSKHFSEIVQNMYRFSPVTLKSADISRFHGIDERISVESFDNCVNFYYRLMEKVSGLSPV